MPGKIQLPHDGRGIWHGMMGATTFPELKDAMSQAIRFEDDNRRALEDWAGEIGGGSRAATLIVAASDSLSTAGADYVCTGTGDDVTINAALAALPAYGGRVLLLEGDYATSNSIVIPKSGVTLQGQGPGTSIVSGVSVANLLTSSSSWNDIVITDMALRGSGGGSLLINSGQTVMQRLLMTNGTASAIRVGIGGPTISDVSVLDCNIGAYTSAVEWERCFRGVISRNQIACTASNLRLTGSSGIGGRVIVQGNMIDGGGIGIALEGGARTGFWVITGNLIVQTGNDGIQVNIPVAGNAVNALIVGNLIYDCVGNGIQFIGSQGHIVDNYCLNNLADGIRTDWSGVANTDAVDIFDNYCRGNVGWGININNAGCTNNIYVGNDTRGNTAGTIRDVGVGSINTYAAGAAPGDNF